MRINFDSSDPFWSLQFYTERYSEKQAARIHQHVSEGNPIWSFTAVRAESELDTLLHQCRQILQLEIERREVAKLKKPWQFWKK